MTITNEKALQNAMRALAHNPLQRRLCWKLQDTYITGIPDQIYLVNRHVTWVELKFVPTHKINRVKKTVNLGVRPAQRIKLQEWAQAGGRALLIAGVAWEEGAALYVIEGLHVPPVNVRVSAMELYALATHTRVLDRANLSWVVSCVLGGPF